MTWRCVDELDQLAVPALSVNGQWEKAFQTNANEAQRRTTNLRRVDLEGGPSINIEQSDQFDQAVLRFIADQ